MWRLHRYLFFSTATIALSSVGILVLLLVTGNALRKVFGYYEEGKISTEALIEVVQLLIPYTFSYAMPAGALIGVLVVVGRLSASNELTALKSSGISIWRVAAPIILFCLLSAGVTAWINAYAAPSARASIRDLIPNAMRANPLNLIVERQFVHEFPGYVLFVGEIEGEGRNALIRDVWIWELDDEKRAVRLLRANAGDLNYDVDRDALVLRLQKGFFELRDESDPDNLGVVQPSLFFEHLQILLPLDEVFGQQVSTVKVSHLSLPEKVDRLRVLESRLENAPEEDREELRGEIMQVRFRIQDGFASAFSALSLGLLAIPLGIKASRKETLVNLAMAIALMLGYYVLAEMIRWLEAYPALRPDLILWTPNLVCQGLALWLFRRAAQH